MSFQQDPRSRVESGQGKRLSPSIVCESPFAVDVSEGNKSSRPSASKVSLDAPRQSLPAKLSPDKTIHQKHHRFDSFEGLREMPASFQRPKKRESEITPSSLSAPLTHQQPAEHRFNVSAENDNGVLKTETCKTPVPRNHKVKLESSRTSSPAIREQMRFENDDRYKPKLRNSLSPDRNSIGSAGEQHGLVKHQVSPNIQHLQSNATGDCKNIPQSAGSNFQHNGDYHDPGDMLIVDDRGAQSVGDIAAGSYQSEHMNDALKDVVGSLPGNTLRSANLERVVENNKAWHPERRHGSETLGSRKLELLNGEGRAKSPEAKNHQDQTTKFLQQQELSTDERNKIERESIQRPGSQKDLANQDFVKNLRSSGVVAQGGTSVVADRIFPSPTNGSRNIPHLHHHASPKGSATATSLSGKSGKSPIAKKLPRDYASYGTEGQATPTVTRGGKFHSNISHVLEKFESKGKPIFPSNYQGAQGFPVMMSVKSPGNTSELEGAAAGLESSRNKINSGLNPSTTFSNKELTTGNSPVQKTLHANKHIRPLTEAEKIDGEATLGKIMTEIDRHKKSVGIPLFGGKPGVNTSPNKPNTAAMKAKKTLDRKGVDEMVNRLAGGKAKPILNPAPDSKPTTPRGQQVETPRPRLKPTPAKTKTPAASEDGAKKSAKKKKGTGNNSKTERPKLGTNEKPHDTTAGGHQFLHVSKGYLSEYKPVPESHDWKKELRTSQNPDSVKAILSTPRQHPLAAAPISMHSNTLIANATEDAQRTALDMYRKSVNAKVTDVVKAPLNAVEGALKKGQKSVAKKTGRANTPKPNSEPTSGASTNAISGTINGTSGEKPIVGDEAEGDGPKTQFASEISEYHVAQDNYYNNMHSEESGDSRFTTRVSVLTAEATPRRSSQEVVPKTSISATVNHGFGIGTEKNLMQKSTKLESTIGKTPRKYYNTLLENVKIQTKLDEAEKVTKGAENRRAEARRKLDSKFQSYKAPDFQPTERAKEKQAQKMEKLQMLQERKSRVMFRKRSEEDLEVENGGKVGAEAEKRARKTSPKPPPESKVAAKSDAKSKGPASTSCKGPANTTRWKSEAPKKSKDREKSKVVFQWERNYAMYRKSELNSEIQSGYSDIKSNYTLPSAHHDVHDDSQKKQFGDMFGAMDDEDESQEQAEKVKKEANRRNPEAAEKSPKANAKKQIKTQGASTVRGSAAKQEELEEELEARESMAMSVPAAEEIGEFDVASEVKDSITISSPPPAFSISIQSAAPVGNKEEELLKTLGTISSFISPREVILLDNVQSRLENTGNAGGFQNLQDVMKNASKEEEDKMLRPIKDVVDAMEELFGCVEEVETKGLYEPYSNNTVSMNDRTQNDRMHESSAKDASFAYYIEVPSVFSPSNIQSKESNVNVNDEFDLVVKSFVQNEPSMVKNESSVVKNDRIIGKNEENCKRIEEVRLSSPEDVLDCVAAHVVDNVAQKDIISQELQPRENVEIADLQFKGEIQSKGSTETEIQESKGSTEFEQEQKKEMLGELISEDESLSSGTESVPSKEVSLPSAALDSKQPQELKSEDSNSDEGLEAVLWLMKSTAFIGAKKNIEDFRHQSKDSIEVALESAGVALESAALEPDSTSKHSKSFVHFREADSVFSLNDSGVPSSGPSSGGQASSIRSPVAEINTTTAIRCSTAADAEDAIRVRDTGTAADSGNAIRDSTVLLNTDVDLPRTHSSSSNPTSGGGRGVSSGPSSRECRTDSSGPARGAQAWAQAFAASLKDSQADSLRDSSPTRTNNHIGGNSHLLLRSGLNSPPDSGKSIANGNVSNANSNAISQNAISHNSGIQHSEESGIMARTNWATRADNNSAVDMVDNMLPEDCYTVDDDHTCAGSNVSSFMSEVNTIGNSTGNMIVEDQRVVNPIGQRVNGISCRTLIYSAIPEDRVSTENASISTENASGHLAFNGPSSKSRCRKKPKSSKVVSPEAGQYQRQSQEQSQFDADQAGFQRQATSTSSRVQNQAGSRDNSSQYHDAVGQKHTFLSNREWRNGNGNCEQLSPRAFMQAASVGMRQELTTGKDTVRIPHSSKNTLELSNQQEKSRVSSVEKGEKATITSRRTGSNELQSDIHTVESGDRPSVEIASMERKSSQSLEGTKKYSLSGLSSFLEELGLSAESSDGESNHKNFKLTLAKKTGSSSHATSSLNASNLNASSLPASSLNASSLMKKSSKELCDVDSKPSSKDSKISFEGSHNSSPADNEPDGKEDSLSKKTSKTSDSATNETAGCFNTLCL